jgi:cellulose synthase/poly-beta-1,6-N-acetylglucosamine synthase-like glycosyltransferase
MPGWPRFGSTSEAGAMCAAENPTSIPLGLRAAEKLVAEGMLSAENFERVRQSAMRWQAPFGEVITAIGGVSGLVWAHALAEAGGLELADLRLDPPNPGLISPADRSDYIRLSMLPWKVDAEGAVVLAAVDPESPDLLSWIARRYPGNDVRIVVTGRFDILWGVQRAFDDIAGLEAREALYLAAPELSAKTTFSPRQAVAAWIIASLLLLGLFFSVRGTLIAVSAVVTVVYTLTFLFRFMLTWVGADRRVDISVSNAEVAALKDFDLPVYTVLVPMYREWEVLPILVDSMRRLDYPRAKLDVKLVLEAGDHETIEAAKALQAESLFEIVRVPNSQPKTKPKACNYALRFARGEYIVVFDAEDIPERDQLKKVVATFRRSSKDVACVQARLNYFNSNDNFLTRMFTLEYSQWFDYLLPGLHTLRIPIPLGGTSNHFRTATLLELGAWDPYNVTEDADLGVRLTQAGYRVAVINSTTFEEANGVLHSWINQRSRWIKGYMQTWLVHMRHPVRLYRKLGFVGFWGFQMFIGFPPLTSLINPLLWVAFITGFAAGPDTVAPFFPGPVIYLAMFNLLVGNAMYIYFNTIAAAKRHYYHLVPWGLLAPAYWLLHSVAAYKALWQLISNPHYWEKTQHGTSSATQEVLARIGDPAKPGVPA